MNVYCVERLAQERAEEVERTARRYAALHPMSEVLGTPRHNRWGRAGGVLLLAAAGAFLSVGAVFDLVSDRLGRLPSDHTATFIALTGRNWAQFASVPKSSAGYITRSEAGYAAFELLFGLLFLIVVAIPLRRGERWAWRSSWLVLGAFSAFGVLFGTYDPANLRAAVVAASLASVALLALRFTPRPSA